MEDNVLPLFEFVHFEDVVGNVLIQEEALKLMTKHDGVIKRIFTHYCSEVGQQQTNHRTDSLSLLSTIICLSEEFVGMDMRRSTAESSCNTPNEALMVV